MVHVRNVSFSQSQAYIIEETFISLSISIRETAGRRKSDDLWISVKRLSERLNGIHVHPLRSSFNGQW